MRFLLPMAYAFLFTLDDDKYTNGKLSDINDNYTYRLLELDVEPSGNEEQLTKHGHKIRPSHTDNSYQQNVIPRVRSVYEKEADDNEADDKEVKKGYKNVKRRVRNDKKLVKLEIPDDFREEISQFEIPNRSRRRVKKKKKFKKSTTPEPDDIKVEEVEDEDENNSQEEEEEVEEKKEKVHKFTVKKKRPFVNITKSLTQNSAAPALPLLPYKAIVDLNRGAGHSAVPPYSVPKIRPLISQENVDMLNPNHYDGGGGGRPRKGIKPRDVNLILRTRHSPKIIIRRYKPLFGAFMGFNLVNHKRTHHRRPHKPSRKKPCKKCKKRRKKNKFYHKFPALASDVETVHSNPSFCNQHQHQQHSSFPSTISNLGLSTFPFYANQPSSSVSYQYSPNNNNNNNNHHSHSYNHNDYLEENLISPRLPSQPVNSYIQMPFENHYYPSETYTTLPFVSTELPFSAKTEYVPIKEEIPDVDGGGGGGGGGGSGGYDVHEHENTEELAANHQQETDVNLEDENDALQYEDDNEDENPTTVAGTGAEEYVENEEEESDPRWDSVFNFSKKPAQKSETEDER